MTCASTSSTGCAAFRRASKSSRVSRSCSSVALISRSWRWRARQPITAKATVNPARSTVAAARTSVYVSSAVSGGTLTVTLIPLGDGEGTASHTSVLPAEPDVKYVRQDDAHESRHYPDKGEGAQGCSRAQAHLPRLVAKLDQTPGRFKVLGFGRDCCVVAETDGQEVRRAAPTAPR